MPLSAAFTAYALVKCLVPSSHCVWCARKPRSMTMLSYPLLSERSLNEFPMNTVPKAEFGSTGSGRGFYGAISRNVRGNVASDALADLELGQGDGGNIGIGTRPGGGNNDDDENARNPLHWYMGLLTKRPLVTKCITSGVLGGISDIIAQLTARATEIDWRRVAALAVVGALLTAPLFHVLYERLEALIPSGKGWRNTVFQLLIDQFLAAPVWLTAFFPLVLLLEEGVNRNSFRDLMAKYERDFYSSLLLTWKIFIPSQTLSFALLPTSLRVLALNVVDLLYVAALSFLSHAPDEHVS